ncbi:unnamed protein product [Urochloa decumbens]|uniref:Dihydroneopterin aldolase/epimerase domain-containing protein n=1 Tax=Urochloa decumbens TaxID=240449 RepID=A0ABC9BET3_9POAL
MAAEDEAVMGPGGDKLILRGLQFHGFHGVMREEQTLGQKFVVDIDAWMDLAAAGESDSIAHTVSYTDIYGGFIINQLIKRNMGPCISI